MEKCGGCYHDDDLGKPWIWGTFFPIMAGKRAINGHGVIGRRIDVLESRELLRPTLTRELMRAKTSQILNKSTAKSVVAFCNENEGLR